MSAARKVAIASLVWSALNFVVWTAATVYVQTHPHLQHSLSYLTFISNYALVAGSFAGITGALAALWSEGS